MIELVAIGLIALLLWMWSNLKQERRQDYTMLEVDRMTGREFEHAVGNLLRAQGFQVTVTPASGDLGVDLIIQRAGTTIAVQTKRYARPVSRTAISDVVGALAHYNAAHGMVVTNATFTEGARTLARSTDTFLVDRPLLAQWIAAARQSAAPDGGPEAAGSAAVPSGGTWSS